MVTGLRATSLTAVAMLAFAANSLLCRMALVSTSITPAMFTSVRLISGALFLWLMVTFFNRRASIQGSWSGALLLFTYAASFSFAYVGMNTGTGALLLFGAVQVTMLTYGLKHGERFSFVQWAGFLLAIGGLLTLLLPGAAAPQPIPAVTMVIAGGAWGIYSLLGKSSDRPLLMTTGNFIRCIPLLILFIPLGLPESLPWQGILIAIISGALASGAGYAIWYSVLPTLNASMAATLQLSVPVLAMFMGWIVLKETITTQMVIAATATLGGVALVIRYRAR